MHAALGACALGLLLAACGQKGPLFLPEQGGVAARPAAAAPSAAEDGRPAAPPAPLDDAGTPGRPATAN